MRKTIFTLSCIISIITLCAFTTYDPPKYKNLKILSRFTSEKAMDSIMNHYSVSLGVTCGYCHVHDQKTDTWDMASDVKGEKLITRRMMLMTNGINGQYFPVEKGAKPIETITCYTCHKGEPMPSDKPKPKEPEKAVDTK